MRFFINVFECRDVSYKGMCQWFLIISVNHSFHFDCFDTCKMLRGTMQVICDVPPVGINYLRTIYYFLYVMC